jgi:hypothetical protein
MKKKVKKRPSSSLSYSSQESSPVKKLEDPRAGVHLRLAKEGSSTPFLTLNNEETPDMEYERPSDYKKQFNNFMIDSEPIQIKEHNLGSNIFFGLNDNSIKNNEGLSFNNSSSATFLHNDN